jgi:hypothetical protein
LTGPYPHENRETMTTTAEPATGRSDDNVAGQPEQQQHREAPATADADLSGIDETIAAAEAETHPGDLTDQDDEGDPLPDSLLAALKTLVPPYAFYHQRSKIPAIVKSFAQAVGAETPEVNAYEVIWTAGEGGWQVPGIYQVGWMRLGCVCGSHPDIAAGYLLDISTPGVTVKEDGLSTDQAVQLLKALRIVR